MESREQAAGDSTAFHVGDGARVGDITVQGDVAGRDIIKITEELTYDVSDLSANPYIGLASYTYATRAFYGGREPLVREAIARLTAPGDEPVLVFVTGASGSGKSSFAQAGLLPALEQAYAAQRRQVRWSVARPGRHPIDALGRALRELGIAEPADGDWAGLLRTPEDLNHLLATQTPRDQVNVLIFDQFEELFTQADPAGRDATCALLSGLGAFRQLRTHVIATLRADYLSALFDAPMLLERFKQDGVELRAMASDELARAIRRPLQAQAQLDGKDKRLDPALVERLVEDVGDDPSLLPLLQVTLRALWDEPPQRLVLDRYRSLTHSLEQQANQLFERDARGGERPEAERAQLMDVFLDLVEVSLDNDPRRDVRRTLPKNELLEGHPERAKLIEELVGARLVTTSVERGHDGDVEVVDIIHETLLGNWPRLSEEIAARREALQQRERFRLALREWLQSGRSGAYLLQGVRLAEARSLAERNDVALRDADGRAFLDASNEAEAEARLRELRQARRRQRILGAVAGVAAIFAAIALVAANAANSSQHQAEDERNTAQAARAVADHQARIAFSRQLAAEAGRQADAAQSPGQLDKLGLALLLGHQAYTTEPTFEARSSLFRSLTRTPVAAFLIASSDDPAQAGSGVAMSPDGALLAAGAWGGDGGVTVWDARTHRPLGDQMPVSGGFVNAVSFSPDGKLLAVGSAQGITLWQMDASRPAGNPRRIAGVANVRGLAFSPDARLLAAGSRDGSVSLWDVSAPEPQRVHPELAWPPGQVYRVAFSPDGRFLAAGGCVTHTTECAGAIHVWDTASAQDQGELRPEQGAEVVGLAFSPGSNLLASASFGMQAQIVVWDVLTRQPAGSALSVPGVGQNQVVFTPDGARLISGGGDGKLRFWDVQTRKPVGPVLEGGNLGTSGVSLAVSTDGTRLLSSVASTVRLWDISSPYSLAQYLGGPGDAGRLAFSRDGATLVSGRSDGTVVRWDTATRRPRGTATPVLNSVSGLALDMDAKTTAVSSRYDSTIALIDAETGSVQREPVAGLGGVGALSYSPDGRLLALGGCRRWVAGGNARSCDGGGVLLVVDGSSRRPVAEALAIRGEVRSLAFGPASTTVLAAGDQTGTITLWDTQARQATGAPLPLGDAVLDMAFSPDGSLLAASGDAGELAMWDMSGPQPRRLDDLVARLPTSGPNSHQSSIAFSPDGTLLAFSLDGTISVWETATRRMLGVPLEGDSPVSQLVFSPDGTLLASSRQDGRLALWDLDAASWLARACSIANRNLSLAEWRLLVGLDVDYAPTCPNLPAGT